MIDANDVWECLLDEDNKLSALSSAIKTLKRLMEDLPYETGAPEKLRDLQALGAWAAQNIVAQAKAENAGRDRAW